MSELSPKGSLQVRASNIDLCVCRECGYNVGDSVAKLDAPEDLSALAINGHGGGYV